MERYSSNPDLVEHVAKAMYEQAMSYVKPKWVTPWKDLRTANQGKAAQIWIDRAKAALDAFQEYE